ncbi:MAG: helix-turn-helix domain-containing protein [Thermosulfidibacteraceae bacterium]|jgi:two-component system nitrogen regulation response regulator GlnG
MKILVLEKDFNTTWIISRILKDHEIISLSTVKDAFLLIQNEDVNLVISSTTLVDGSIWDLKDYFHKVPFFLITSNPAFDKVDELTKYGVLGFIKKPISKEELLKIVEEVSKKTFKTDEIIILEETTQKVVKKIKENILMKTPFLVIGEEGVGKKTLIRHVATSLKLTTINQSLDLDGGRNTVTIIDISNIPIKHMEIIENKILNFDHNTIPVFVFNGQESDLYRENRLSRNLLNIIGMKIIEVKPLRERKGEIIPLLKLYLKKFNKEADIRLTNNAEKYLTEYNWPGNIRELIEVSKELAYISVEEIDIYHLPAEILYGYNYPFTKLLKDTVRKMLVNNHSNIYQDIINVVETVIIKEALKESNYNQSVAAKKLGLHRNTIRYKIRELKITNPRRREIDEDI